jgi:hypothetical protein
MLKFQTASPPFTVPRQHGCDRVQLLRTTNATPNDAQWRNVTFEHIT